MVKERKEDEEGAEADFPTGFACLAIVSFQEEEITIVTQTIGGSSIKTVWAIFWVIAQENKQVVPHSRRTVLFLWFSRTSDELH